MALDTFSALKTTLAAWLWRSGDTDLTTYVPDFISLAEAEMNRRINTRRKVTRVDFAIDGEFETVPTDFSSVVSFRLSSTDPDSELRYAGSNDAARMIGENYGDATGQPGFYTIVGDQFQFIAPPDGSYTAKLTYRQKIPALSEAAPSNWVLVDHPDIYLYGSLVHSAPFLKDDPRVTTWGAFHERAIASLERSDSLSSFGGQVNMRASRSFG